MAAEPVTGDLLLWKILALVLVLTTLAVQIFVLWPALADLRRNRRARSPEPRWHLVVGILIAVVEVPVILFFVLFATPVGHFLVRNDVARAALGLGVTIVLVAYLRGQSKSGRS